MKKYEIIKENTIKKFNTTLYQIRALVDIDQEYNEHIVKAGDLGGYVESEDNLSQEGNCWITGNACILDNAKVSGNALVSGKSIVYSNAKISENARVYYKSTINGYAKIFGDAVICDKAFVSRNAKVFGDSIVADNAVVTDNAVVCDKGIVCGNAVVNGNQRVRGNSVINIKLRESSNTVYYASWRVSDGKSYSLLPLEYSNKQEAIKDTYETGKKHTKKGQSFKVEIWVGNKNDNNPKKRVMIYSKTFKV